jgi:transketolase
LIKAYLVFKNIMTSKELSWRIRRLSLDMINRSHASHIGAIYSVADIIAVLYNDILHIDPKNPKIDTRDRFILSKGHAGVAVYIALAELGFFSTEKLETYYTDGSYLSGHISHHVPGIELSTGSLGHGICVGVGMAMAAKLDNKTHQVFVVLGDGECEEGSVWEAALFAYHFKLSNLVIIIDHNKLQSLDSCENTLSLGDLEEKWRSFGWTVERVNGHDHEMLRKHLQNSHKDKPLCIIADTIKGKGVSFMENEVLWHYRDPQDELYNIAVVELDALKP